MRASIVNAKSPVLECRDRRQSKFIVKTIRQAFQVLCIVVYLIAVLHSFLDRVKYLFPKRQWSFKHMCLYIGEPEKPQLLLPEGKPHLNSITWKTKRL